MLRLKPRLQNAVRAAMLDSEPDNPIYRVAKESVIREINAGDNTQLYMLNRLDEIERAINRISTDNASKSENISNSRTMRIIFLSKKGGEDLELSEIIQDIVNVGGTPIASTVESNRILVTVMYSHFSPGRTLIEKLSEKYGIGEVHFPPSDAAKLFTFKA